MRTLSRLYNMPIAGMLLLVLTIIPAVVSRGSDDTNNGTSPQGTSSPSTASSTTCSPWTINGTTINFQRCLTTTDGYNLNWILNGSTVTIGVSYQTSTNWVGIGFSDSGGMVGSSAIIGKPMSNGVVVQEYYLGGTSVGAVVLSNKLGSSGLQGDISSGAMRFIFTVTLAANKIASSNLIWANGPLDPSGALSIHSSKSSSTTSFSTGTTVSTEAPGLKLRRAHGFISALAWGLLIPFGILVARHGKRHDPAWYYTHLVCQTLGFVLGLIGFITGLVASHESETDHGTHKSIGVFVIILGILQVLAICFRPHKGAKLRWIWEIQHHWSGRAALVLAIANIYLGLDILKPGKGWTILFSIVIVVFVVTAIALEIWRQCFGGGIPADSKAVPLRSKINTKGSEASLSQYNTDDVEMQGYR